MMKPVTEWLFYRYRFVISYALLTAGIAILLGLSFWHVPPGLSASEQQSVVTSAQVSYTQLPTQVVDLPYHALQKLTVQWLGVSAPGVRLPSIIIGAATALCIVLILRRWFKPNVAIVASIVVLTSSWFLGMARLGSPAIMVPFWTSALVLAATYVSQQTKHWGFWKIVFLFSAALSFYTPYMTYLFIAALLAALAQPHLRYLIRESSKVGISIGLFFFIAVLAPLGWGIYKDPGVVRDLLAIPAALPGVLQFGHDLLQAASNLVNPYAVNAGEIITPTLSVASAVLLLLGGFQLLKDFHSVRAYVLLIWAALLIPVIGFNPHSLQVLFVPAMLVMAIGVHLIIRYWYRLFPRNPYARIFGLLPLAILVFSVVQFNYQRYFYGMMYSPQAIVAFNSDAFLAQSKLDSLAPTTPVTIVVAPQDQPLYQIMANRRAGTAALSGSQALVARPGTWLVAEDQISLLAGHFTTPPGLIVNDHKSSALRFRVYQQ